MRTLTARGVAAAVAAAAVLPASALAAGPGWTMTHKVSIEGEFVNHWTISEDQDCDPVGAGTLTAKFHTTVATRVRPYLDDYKGGGWNVAIPHGYKGHLLTAMGPAKIAGTITRVDNTTPRPFADITDPCPPLDKMGCGTFPIPSKRGTGVYVYGGHRPKDISVHAGIGFTSGACLIGDAASFDATQALVGGNRDGNVLVRMPKPSAFKRPVVRLTAKTHKRTSGGDPGEHSSNDITRRVTVTFKRL